MFRFLRKPSNRFTYRHLPGEEAMSCIDRAICHYCENRCPVTMLILNSCLSVIRKHRKKHHCSG